MYQGIPFGSLTHRSLLSEVVLFGILRNKRLEMLRGREALLKKARYTAPLCVLLHWRY